LGRKRKIEGCKLNAGASRARTDDLIVANDALSHNLQLIFQQLPAKTKADTACFFGTYLGRLTNQHTPEIRIVAKTILTTIRNNRRNEYKEDPRNVLFLTRNVRTLEVVFQHEPNHQAQTSK
jgi:hypothetical protein